MSRMIWLAVLKSAVSLFLVNPNAVPVAVSPYAKLPPAPPIPNAVGVSCAAGGIVACLC